MFNAIALCLATSIGAGMPDRDDQRFTIHATLVEALEKGPFIIKISLTYRGNDPIVIGHDAVIEDFVDGKACGWKARSITIFGSIANISRGNPIELAKGDTLEATYFVDAYFDRIRPGKVRLRVRWPVVTGRGEFKVIACPKTVLDINVLAATEENQRAVAARLEQRLANKEFDDRATKKLIRSMLESKLPGFCPLGLKMLKSGTCRGHEPSMISMIYKASTYDPTDSFVSLVCEPQANRSSWHARVLWYWNENPSTISEVQLRRLLQSRSVAVVGMMYVGFGHRLGRTEADDVLQQIAALNTPPAAAEFQRLVRLLDDDVYDEREAATAALGKHGECIAHQLSECLKTDLPPEPRQRIRMLLADADQIREDGLPEPVADLVAFCNADRGKAARRLLEVLMLGSKHTRLHHEAEKILMSWQKK